MVVGYHHFRKPPSGFGPHFFSKGKTSVTQFRHKTFHGRLPVADPQDDRMHPDTRRALVREEMALGSNLWDSMVWKSCHDFLIDVKNNMFLP